MENDLTAIRHLQENYGKYRVKLIRYEDVAMFPFNTTNKLFRDLLDLEVKPQWIQKYIKNNMNVKNKYKRKSFVELPFQTRRKSANQTAFKWTKKMSEDEFANFNEACKNIFDKLGYLKTREIRIEPLKFI